MLTFDGSCPPIGTCREGGLPAAREGLPGCFALPGLVYVANTDAADATGGAHFATVGAGPGVNLCGNPNTVGEPLLFPTTAPDWNPAGGFCTGPQTCGVDPDDTITRINLVRYQIAPDPADNTPALWRSDFGEYNAATGVDDDLQPPNGRWQLIARGIEDLQVQYQDGPSFAANPQDWLDVPPAANAADAGTIVRRVRVTLSARALAINLQGESASAQGNAVRGRLVGITSPRGALINLQMASGSPPPWQ
jgi:hypothetical protein